MKSKIDNIEFEIKKDYLHQNLGGQSCGMIYSPFTLICEDIGLEIKLSHFRNELKSKELLHKILEFTINEIKK